MKKIILAGVGALFLSISMAGHALAVWPPSTVLENDAKAAQARSSEQGLHWEEPRPRGLADRLEEDEKRLHNVLLDLEKDSKELKQSSKQR